MNYSEQIPGLHMQLSLMQIFVVFILFVSFLLLSHQNIHKKKTTEKKRFSVYQTFFEHLEETMHA